MLQKTIALCKDLLEKVHCVLSRRHWGVRMGKSAGERVAVVIRGQVRTRRWDFEEEGHGDGNNLQSGGNVAPPEPSLLLCGHSGAVAVLHAWEGAPAVLMANSQPGKTNLGRESET